MDRTSKTSAVGRGSVLYVKILVRAAEQLGVDIGPLLDAVNISRADVQRASADADVWFPRESVYRLWSKLAEAAKDDDLGLHIAERQAVESGNVGVLEYTARNAPTLGEAFQRVERYGRLVHDGAEFRFERGLDRGTLSYSLPDLPEGPNRHAAEWAAATWVLKGRHLIGRALEPVEVRFRHRAPRRTDEHARLFGCRVLFSDARTEVTVRAEDLDAPVVGADPGLGALLDGYGKELLQRLPKAITLEDRARHYLVKALSSGGDPSLQAMAKALAMSPRSLQRHLKEGGLTHRELVEDVRERLARRYVEDGKLSLAEIAFLLGFSEPSAFLRAFRRWTGTSPGRLRSGEGQAIDDDEAPSGEEVTLS